MKNKKIKLSERQKIISEIRKEYEHIIEENNNYHSRKYNEMFHYKEKYERLLVEYYSLEKKYHDLEYGKEVIIRPIEYEIKDVVAHYNCPIEKFEYLKENNLLKEMMTEHLVKQLEPFVEINFEEVDNTFFPIAGVSAKIKIAKRGEEKCGFVHKTKDF